MVIKVCLTATTFNVHPTLRRDLQRPLVEFAKLRSMSLHKCGMERLRAQLICGVCLNFLCEPKLLECAHSFCQECLVSVVQKQGIYRTADSPLHENDVECPCCRQPTRLQRPDSDGVNALRTNFNLKELVEIVSKEEKEQMRDKLGVRRSRIFPRPEQTPQFEYTYFKGLANCVNVHKFTMTSYIIINSSQGAMSLTVL